MSVMVRKNDLSVLVVGSHNHPLAVETVGWGEEFYVGEYDAVIFNLPALQPHMLSEILSHNANYFASIKKHIIDLQTGESGIPIYCILDKLNYSKSYDENLDLSNYGWSPIVPILEEVPGREINKKTSELPEGYLKLIDGWIGFFDSALNNTGYNLQQQSGDLKFRYHLKSLLKNRAGKDLAFELTWSIRRESAYVAYNEVIIDSKSPITFLLQTKNVAEGINVLLQSLTNHAEEELAPAWVNTISVCGENNLLESINESTTQKEFAQKSIVEKTAQLDNLRKHKKLLYAQGHELHVAVEEAFNLLGVNVKRVTPSNKEDLVFEEGGNVIPMEVRGKDTTALNENDVRQVISRLKEKSGTETYKTRGVFILNHFRLTEPINRGIPFEKSIVKDLVVPWGVALITTQDLFYLVDRCLAGEDMSHFKTELLNTVGVYLPQPLTQ